MGFRTVIALNNDLSHEWQRDPELGRKIFEATSGCRSSNEFQYGAAIEQVHADVQSLIITDGYQGKAIAHTNWYSQKEDSQRDLELLKAFAERMGYRIVRKSAK